MKKVLFSAQPIADLTELIEILYNDEYFGFKEDAKKYVEELLKYVADNLPTMYKKSAPEYFSHFGKDLSYAFYRKNKHTVWYVFFNEDEDAYNVRHIANNHSIAHLL